MTISGLIFWIAVLILWLLIYSKRKQSRLAASLIDVLSDDDDDELRVPRKAPCPRCGVELDLTRFERHSEKFTCPRCGTLSHVSTLSLDENIRKWQSIFRLLPFVDCPKCGAELELSRQERIAGEFICPECQRRTESTSGINLRQHHLSKHPVCPECSHETTLLDIERNKPSFICPYCHQEINYVEE